MKKKSPFPKFSLLIIVLVIIISSCSIKTQTFSLAFYNVENLFDTINDPTIHDETYLPGSELDWDTEKYQHKLDNIAKVLRAIDTVEFPATIGLAEVENIGVLNELVKHPTISKAGYKILHQEGKDERGIDVALLYIPEKYMPSETQYISLNFPFGPEVGVRDILYSKGVVNEKDTVHIFINHWKSRWGGQEESEPFRRYTANLLKSYTDSIFKIQPNANIIIAGDLNDNPDDLSISQDLNAIEPALPYHDKKLYNLSIKQYKTGEGTLYFKSWDMFDQIIVSTSILNGKNGMMATSPDQIIIKEDWMLFYPKHGEPRPNRTAARDYYGGYSDHLPVYIKIITQ